MEYSTSCGGNNPLQLTNECDGIKSGDVIEFNLQVTVCLYDFSSSSPVQHIQLYCTVVCHFLVHINMYMEYPQYIYVVISASRKLVHLFPR